MKIRPTCGIFLVRYEIYVSSVVCEFQLNLSFFGFVVVLFTDVKKFTCVSLRGEAERERVQGECDIVEEKGES